jgi:hypothetical protein
VGEQMDVIQSGLENAGHSLYTDGRWVRCKVCCKRRKCKFERWDKLPCCRGGLAALGKRKADGQSRDVTSVVGIESKAAKTDANEPRPSEDGETSAARHAFDEEEDPFGEQLSEPEVLEESGEPLEYIGIESIVTVTERRLIAPAGVAWGADNQEVEYATRAAAAKRRKDNKAASRVRNLRGKRNRATAWHRLVSDLSAHPATDQGTGSGSAHPWSAIHESHDLRVVSKVVVCARCGGWSSRKRSFKLRRVCESRIKAGTVTAFRKILKGLNPLQPANKAHRRARGASKGKYERRGPLEEATKTVDGINAVRLQRKENVHRAVAEASSNDANSTGHGCDGASEAKGEGRHVCETNLRKRKWVDVSDEPAACFARLLTSCRSHRPEPGARGSAGKRSTENDRALAPQTEERGRAVSPRGRRRQRQKISSISTPRNEKNGRAVAPQTEARGRTVSPRGGRRQGQKRSSISTPRNEEDDCAVAPPAACRGRAVLPPGGRRQERKRSMSTPRNEENDRAVAPPAEKRGRTVSPRSGRKQGQKRSSISTPRNEEKDRAVAPPAEERGRTVSPRGGRKVSSYADILERVRARARETHETSDLQRSQLDTERCTAETAVVSGV